MHFVDTELDSDGAGWLIVRDHRGARDLAALLVYRANETACTPAGHCLINPPSWTYWVGGHHRYSLGGLLWHVGQWAYRRTFDSPVVHRTPISREEMVTSFGWSPGTLGATV